MVLCRNCRALHGLSHLGPEGYHWRVCVEDKPVPGDTSTRKSYSWWDIQDENAVLPIKEASSSQLNKFFTPRKEDSVQDQATKAAKGAFKSLGKALAGGASESPSDNGPPVQVIAFKLLDLVKVHDDFTHKNHGRGGHIPQDHTPRQPRPARSEPRQSTTPVSATGGGYAPPSQQQQRRPVPQQQNRQQPRPKAQAAARPPAPTADLMGFGAPTQARPAAVHHSHSMSTSSGSVPGETRAERLKREYQKKNATAQRVWDDVDQRWVEKQPAARPVSSVNSAGQPTAAKKQVGISIDPNNAINKSKEVQAAVGARYKEMQDSQAKALQEVRQREAKKKADEAEEDEVRKRLEPKIKAWSEEHGKKKQLRALLGTLHTILWPGARWKQISIGDMLDRSKCKKFYHKATLVVHPDKTHDLDAEKRFLAKRIFDALSQAKVEFDAAKQ